MNHIDRELNKLKQRVHINNLTLELFLNSQVFQQDSSQAGIYICIYKKDPRYVYIGKTNDFLRRWKEHERDLKNSNHCGYFQEFYTKYQCSLDDFEWDILDFVENDDEKITALERFRINQYNTDGFHILLNTQKNWR